jgi:aminoglycoside N3'-acetyltransferase
MSRFDLTGELRDLGVDEGDVLMARSEIHHERTQRADRRFQRHHDTGGPTFDRSHGSQRGMHHDFAWVNGRPKAERSFLLRAAPAFDKDRTPADPDVGVLAEVFRQLPGTLVNDHPDGRFGARGHRSAAVLQDPLPWDDYYGPGSTLERLVTAGAKILRLGADPDTVTLLHLASSHGRIRPRRRRAAVAARMRVGDTGRWSD